MLTQSRVWVKKNGIDEIFRAIIDEVESQLNIDSDAGEFGEHPLRLYCSRINHQIVILFNGGRKTTLKVQDCPNVAGYFRQANKIQKQIDQDIRDGHIKIENGQLIFDEDYLILL